MSDLLEEQLAQRLRAVAEQTPAELEPPEDLQARVARARRSRRLAAGLTALAVAALIMAAVAMVATVQRSPAKRPVAVAAPTHDRISLVGRIKPNVVMLDARGHYVVALDRDAHAVDTLVVSKGNVVDAQLSNDQTTLWYLVTNGTAGVDCGRVVRVDVGTGATHVILDAVEFAISPDGRTLAYDECGSTHLELRDLTTGTTTPALGAHHWPIAFAPDGQLVQEECAMAGCTVRYGAQSASPSDPTGVAVGADGVYVTDKTRLRVMTGAPGTPRVVLDLNSEWSIKQVLPTRAGLFFTSDPPYGRALFRVDNGRPVKVSTFAFGKLTPVLPLH